MGNRQTIDEMKENKQWETDTQGEVRGFCAGVFILGRGKVSGLMSCHNEAL